ncbi:MAG: hypothetical protein ACTSQN_13030 [Candidatus Heimdallarchaeota archaeon]
MKKVKNIILFLTIILSLSLGIISHPISYGENLRNSQIEKQGTAIGDITFPFTKTLALDGDNNWNMTDLLTVNETLDNLVDFEGDGITSYVGADVIPDISANRYNVRVTLVNSTIWNDHDIGPGEIYFNVTINGNFTRTINYSANDDETLYLDLSVFNAWCLTLDITVEVWEDDTFPTPDDELGVVHWVTTNPSSGFFGDNTTFGDAEVWLEVEVLDTEADVTAQFLADGCKPYFYISDETTHTDEADNVTARVLVGPDADKGISNAICIQYLFYWVEEYFPFPVDVKFHEDDYEEFLIFIDPSDIMSPYRFVFDDGSYVSNTHSSRIAIWQDQATTSILETEAYVSDGLTPLLGSNFTTDYKIFNITDVDDEIRTGISGIDTMNILVQTSFHNFQEGQPGILDLSVNELGFNYTVGNLTDEVIKDYFRNHYKAFEEGLWFISYIGLDTPKVHPFTFDIMNPFVFPYVINAYPNVVDDIDAFQEANKNFINYEFDIEISFGFLIYARYSITTPEEVRPGQEFDATIEVEILEDQTEIALLYDLFVNTTFKALFLDKNYLFDYEGKIAVDIPIATMRNILEFLGYAPYEQEDLNIDEAGYFTLDNFYLSPTILGTIMAANASVHFWDIILGEMPGLVPLTEKPLNLLDYFVESIDLTLGAGLEGFTNGTINAEESNGVDVDTTSFEFDGTTMSEIVHVTVDDNVNNGDYVGIVLDDLAYNFKFFADWNFNIQFGTIISLIAPQYGEMNFNLGTFPNIDFTSSDTPILSAETVEQWIEVNVDATVPSGILLSVFTALGFTVFMIAVVIRKSKK